MTNLIRALALAPALAAGLALAAAPASASGLPFSSAGEVQPNGTIGYGTGFTAQHNGTGLYTITYPTSTGFTSLPVVVASPFGLNGHETTAVISSISGSNGGVVFTVNIYDIVGKKAALEDNAFMFLLMES